MKQTKIKKLVIELGGKDVELTLAQAKELQAALNELFEERVVQKVKLVPQPFPVPDPYPIYPRPWRPYRPWHEPWITWSGESPLYKTTTGAQFSLGSGNSLRCQLTGGDGSPHS